MKPRSLSCSCSALNVGLTFRFAVLTNSIAVGVIDDVREAEIVGIDEDDDDEDGGIDVDGNGRGNGTGARRDEIKSEAGMEAKLEVIAEARVAEVETEAGA